jgi:hypothetical protein
MIEAYEAIWKQLSKEDQGYMDELFMGGRTGLLPDPEGRLLDLGLVEEVEGEVNPVAITDLGRLVCEWGISEYSKSTRKQPADELLSETVQYALVNVIKAERLLAEIHRELRNAASGLSPASSPSWERWDPERREDTRQFFRSENRIRLDRVATTLKDVSGALTSSSARVYKALLLLHEPPILEEE